MHISGAFKAPEKANMEGKKANIEGLFTAKTAFHVSKLLEEFGFHTVFGRSDVQKILGLKATRSSEMIREMAKKGMIEPVAGLGKGKYKFKEEGI